MNAEAVKLIEKLAALGEQQSAKLSQIRASIAHHHPEKLARCEPLISDLESKARLANVKLNQLRMLLTINAQVEEEGRKVSDILGYGSESYVWRGCRFGANQNIITSVVFKDGSKLKLKRPVNRYLHQPKITLDTNATKTETPHMKET